MATNTTQYNFQKPEVGADTDAWGDMLNANWDSTDSLLRGATALTRIGIGATNTTIPLVCNAASATDITATFSGKVGIGTDIPERTLHIKDAIAGIRLEDSDGTSYGEIIYNEGSNGLLIRSDENAADSGSNIIFEVDGSESARIDTSGKVGIGATNPYVKTEIAGGDLAVGGGAGAGNLGFEIKGVPLSAIPSAQVRGYIATADTGLGVRGDLLIAPRTSANTSVRFITGTSPTERMRIDASGNVGIGTVSPANTLTVGALEASENDQDATVGIKCNANHRGIILQENSGAEQWEIGVGEAGGLKFYDSGSATPAVTFADISGNVGIGNTSPQSKLVVQATGGCVSRIVATDGGNQPSATAQIAMQGYGGRGAGIFIQDSKLSTSNPNDRAWFMGTGYSTASFGIGYAADGVNSHYLAQNMLTVDTFGSLLVGTTDSSVYNSTSGGNTGFVYSPNSFLQVARETTTATQSLMNLNKMGSDGNIIELYKDGTTVGSIGVDYGDRLYIGTGNTGLFFNDTSSAIQPIDTGSNLRDNAVDLGSSGTRFKDLFLSGGVYLGGTGTANKLDDYEEGTWTPNLYGTTTGSNSLLSYGSAATQYTKVGRLIHFNAYITNVQAANHSKTGEFRISGLPFAASRHAPVTISYSDLFTFDETDISVSGYVSNGSTYISVRKGSSKGAVFATELTNNNLSDFMISGSYITS